MNAKKTVIIVGVILALAVGGAVFAMRGQLRDAYSVWKRGPVPPEVTREEALRTAPPAPTPVPAPAPTPEPEPVPAPAPTPAKPVSKDLPPPPPAAAELPATMNLRVVFVPQAPFKVWDATHEDTCEEATVVMLQSYLDGETKLSLQEMEDRMLAMVEWQEKEPGFGLSITAEQVTDMMRRLLGIGTARVLPLATADDLRRQIAAGRPVILPTSGRTLNNPNFKNGGPLYHMLVVKGYTADGRFVTNDPGTRLGENYVYDEATLMAAAHDWNGGDVLNGKKVMIIAD